MTYRSSEAMDWTARTLVPHELVELNLRIGVAVRDREVTYALEARNPSTNELLALRVLPLREWSTPHTSGTIVYELVARALEELVEAFPEGPASGELD